MDSQNDYKHYMYVWMPFVEDYHKMGWTLAGDQCAIYPHPRGEHLTFLMEWPCSCKVPYMKRETRAWAG